MKSHYNFKTLFYTAVLFVTLTAVTFSQNSVSGTVRYADNNEIVTSGYVNAYDASSYSLLATTPIHSDGSYLFSDLQSIQTDIIGFPNHELGEDFIPTYYPNEQDWQYAVSILPNGQMTGIDIYVERVPGEPGKPSTGYTIAGSVTTDNTPITDAIIHVKDTERIIAYAISSTGGNFKVKDVPQGDYILVIQRIGYNTVIKNVTVTNEGIKGIEVNLMKYIKQSNTNEINKFSLSQNYPNPFNPVTKFSYTLPKTSKVSVIVYDIMGRVVSELVNECQNAGSYEVEFNGSKLSSGVYYYRLISDTYSDTKRMILVK